MLGFPELIIILAIAFLVFGAGKLPEVGSSLGRAIRDFRRATSGQEDEPDEKPDEEAESENAPALNELPSGQATTQKPSSQPVEETTKS